MNKQLTLAVVLLLAVSCSYGPQQQSTATCTYNWTWTQDKFSETDGWDLHFTETSGQYIGDIVADIDASCLHDQGLDIGQCSASFDLNCPSQFYYFKLCPFNEWGQGSCTSEIATGAVPPTPRNFQVSAG